MEHIVKNMVIWIFLSAIEVVHAMSRDDLNRFTFPRKDMGHCKLKKDEKYSCWIGKSMLLRENEFYRMLKLKATSGNLVILSFTDFSYVDISALFEGNILRYRSLASLKLFEHAKKDPLQDYA